MAPKQRSFAVVGRQLTTSSTFLKNEAYKEEAYFSKENEIVFGNSGCFIPVTKDCQKRNSSLMTGSSIEEFSMLQTCFVDENGKGLCINLSVIFFIHQVKHLSNTVTVCNTIIYYI